MHQDTHRVHKITTIDEQLQGIQKEIADIAGQYTELSRRLIILSAQIKKIREKQ